MNFFTYLVINIILIYWSCWTRSFEIGNANMVFVSLMDAVGSWGGGHVLLDIRRVCFSGCEQEQRKRGNTSWDINCLGASCDGARLLCWSYLWCPFQSCCHHCFCLHQKVSLEAGDPNFPFFIHYWFKLVGKYGSNDSSFWNCVVRQFWLIHTIFQCNLIFKREIRGKVKETWVMWGTELLRKVCVV